MEYQVRGRYPACNLNAVACEADFRTAQTETLRKRRIG